MTLNEIAESYVKLVLAIGLYDPFLVDAYSGPDDWKPDSQQKDKAGYSLQELARNCADLLSACARCSTDDSQRKIYIEKHLLAMATKLRMLQGEELSFDAESQGLYDAVLPELSEEVFREAIAELQDTMPGEGSLGARYIDYLKQFVIPADKVSAVFDAAVFEARRRTVGKIELPQNESFTIEYVTGQPWGAYNWFKGDAFSLIQVNTDLPIHIHRPVGLACHEGYPGHHVFHSLLEQDLCKAKGHVEYLINPLFSPQSMIAEGTANYGIRLAFTHEEQRSFEREFLYPLAGLNPELQDKLRDMKSIFKKLRYADNYISRLYLDKVVTRDETVKWLADYSVTTEERAKKRLDFVERYRTYVINYTLGEDIVKNYVESKASDRDGQWQVFTDLLRTPQVPSFLTE
jgi:hypothetical protein